MGNIIGNNPQKWAANQVNLRQQLLGKKNQTPEILSWQTNKTAWIRAISAVQIDEKTAEELSGRKSMGGGKLAQEYVLFNGTVGLEQNTDGDGNKTYNQKTNLGVYSGPNPQTGINSSAYGFEYDSSRGLVPMPGIEDLTISTYNRGSLRRASFKLKAYNKKQFAILDALFMRPGFTLLLEWGHTTYFKGTPEAPIYTKAKFNTRPFLILNDFLEGKDSLNGQSEILSAIVKERGNGESGDGTAIDQSGYKVKGSQGNYDGFYGKITNFVWSLNPDGSYNIEVKAISTGDIIESLTIDRIESTQDAKPAEKKITGLKTVSNENKNTTPSTYDLQGTDKYGTFTITKPYEDRVKYREYWYGSNSPLTLSADGKTFTGSTEDIKVYKANKNLPTVKKNTLKRKFTLSPEDPGPDILITNQDKSILNGYLYSNYNYLKRNFQTLFSNIPTNSENEKQTIRVLNTFDSSDKSKPEPDPNFSNLIMIQPKVVRDVLDANSGTVVNTTEKLSQNAPYQYIELRRLLQFIDSNLLIYNGGALNEAQKEALLKGETPPEDKGEKKNENILNLDIGTEIYMYTQPTQFSSDPNVCIIPFEFPTSKVDPGKDGKLGTDDDVITVSKDNKIRYFQKVLEGCSFRDTESSHVANMLSIPVNLHYIGKVLKQVTSNNSVPLLKFLEQLLYGIQVALGSINKFSVTYDHDTNHIIFRDDIPLDPAVAPQTVVGKDDRVLFNVNGVKPNEENASFVNNVSISTTLSNKFATMISIGAQANTKSDIANATSFGRWNAGLTDSITPSKLSKAGIESKNKTQNDPDRLWKRSVASLNKKQALLTSFYKEGKVPTGDVQSTAQSQNANYNKYIATTDKTNQKNNPIPSTQGFIPFSMNLDMDGFSGLRIYEKFYITTEILPPSYPRTLSFLCKGITHTINNSGWKTKIDSLTVTSVDTLDANGNPIKLNTPPNTYNSKKYEIE